MSLTSSTTESIDSAFSYAEKANGPLTVMGGVEGMAFIDSKYGNQSEDEPDIGLNFVSGSTITGISGFKTWKAHGLKETFYKSMYKSILNKDVWSALPVSKICLKKI